MKITQRGLKAAVLLLGFVFLVLLPQPFPGHLLKFDFRAYWSASRLLAQRENFSSEEALLQLQQEETGWEGEEPLFTWNPPWLIAFFLPFGLLPFEKASWLWFLLNLSMIFASTALIWRLFAAGAKTRRRLWVGLLLAFLFLPALTTLLVGQITTLVLLGVIAFLWFQNHGKPFTSGLALALTAVKPHLVYILLFLVGLELLARRDWRAIAGFLSPLAILTAVVFLLRPTFLSEYAAVLGANNLFQRTTVPTLTGFLAQLFDLPALRLGGLLALPLAMWLWWHARRKGRVNLAALILWTLPASIVTAPFGWSFDSILLLVPLLVAAIWALERAVPWIASSAALIIYVAANVLFFYQRSLQRVEAEYFWFPIVMAILSLACWWLARDGLMVQEDAIHV